jgi:hypothetical protein
MLQDWRKGGLPENTIEQMVAAASQPALPNITFDESGDKEQLNQTLLQGIEFLHTTWIKQNAERQAAAHPLDVTEPHAAHLIQALHNSGVSEQAIKNAVMYAAEESFPPPSMELQDMTPAQRQSIQGGLHDIELLHEDWLQQQEVARRSQAFAKGLVSLLGSGFALALGVSCFVGGLLGWLLVMRKKVLACTVCGATMSAS